MKKTDIGTLVVALQHLARDIQSADGVANAVIAEAAARLSEIDGSLPKTADGVGMWPGMRVWEKPLRSHPDRSHGGHVVAIRNNSDRVSVAIGGSVISCHRKNLFSSPTAAEGRTGV